MHPRLDVEAARTHLVEPGRFDEPVFAGPAHHRVDADLEEDPAVELPHLVTLDGLDDPGRERLEATREPTVEHPGGLDEVVVDRDQGVEHGPRLRIGEQAVELALAPVQGSLPARLRSAHAPRVA